MSIYTPILPSRKWFESVTKRQIEKMQVIEKVKACCIGAQAVDLGSGCTNQVLVYYKYGPNNTSFMTFAKKKTIANAPVTFSFLSEAISPGQTEITLT